MSNVIDEIQVDFYDDFNGDWIDVTAYILSMPPMPQIFNNRDFSLVCPTLSFRVGKNFTSKIIDYDNQLIDYLITKIKIYKPDESFLFFEGVFDTCKYNKFTLEYTITFKHEFQLMKNQVFTRTRYDAALVTAGDENTYWKYNNTWEDGIKLSPNQLFRKLIEVDCAKEIDTSEISISLDYKYVDRGAAFAINQDVADKGRTNFNVENDATAFDVLDNMCKQLMCYITYDRANYGHYKIIIPADYDSSAGLKDDRFFKSTNNTELAYTDKTGDYVRNINYTTYGCIGYTGSLFNDAYETYDNFATTAINLFSDYNLLGAVKWSYINLKSNCYIGLWNGGDYNLGALYSQPQINMRYKQKVKEYTYTAPALYSGIPANIINMDYVLDSKRGVVSKITQEFLQYNPLIVGSYTANNTGNATLSASESSANAYIARAIPGAASQTWDSLRNDEVPGSVWYKFDFGIATRVHRFSCYSWIGASKCTLQGSNDNSTFTDIGELAYLTNSIDFEVIKYRYYRLYFAEADRNTGAIYITRPQFYERIL